MVYIEGDEYLRGSYLLRHYHISTSATIPYRILEERVAPIVGSKAVCFYGLGGYTYVP